MEDKEMVDFSEKLDEAYNRGLKAGFEMGAIFFKKHYEEDKELSNKYMNDIFNVLDEQFNLVKKENAN